MGKRKYKSTKKKNKKQQDWPLVVFVWIIGLGLFGYIFGQIALAYRPHSYHWLSGLAGMAAGLIVGWLWYYWRGDIV